MIEKYPNDVKLAFMNYPIRSHKYAEKAARAALAADRQGKFWEFHDKLFEDYKNLNDEKVRGYAKELKLDLQQFENDWKDARIIAKVNSDQQIGSKAGVRGTPTVFINGRRLKQRSLEDISKMIDAELQKAK